MPDLLSPPRPESPGPDPREITRLLVNNELHTCPDCGYDRGFHTSLVTAHASKNTPLRSTREVYRVILICPECGARYDIGWQVTLENPRITVVKTSVLPPD
jgi:predicted RNA-binding Zn-ribbon protein involved in translation (DUF1610 family)